MIYQVLIERYTQKQILQLSKSDIPAIKAAIASLANDPRSYCYIKLKGTDF